MPIRFVARKENGLRVSLQPCSRVLDGGFLAEEEALPDQTR
jgi:hypothetical protein